MGEYNVLGGPGLGGWYGSGRIPGGANVAAFADTSTRGGNPYYYPTFAPERPRSRASTTAVASASAGGLAVPRVAPRVAVAEAEAAAFAAASASRAYSNDRYYGRPVPWGYYSRPNAFALAYARANSGYPYGPYYGGYGLGQFAPVPPRTRASATAVASANTGGRAVPRVAPRAAVADIAAIASAGTRSGGGYFAPVPPRTRASATAVASANAGGRAVPRVAPRAAVAEAGAIASADRVYPNNRYYDGLGDPLTTIGPAGHVTQTRLGENTFTQTTEGPGMSSSISRSGY